jgi:hypothetical protein
LTGGDYYDFNIIISLGSGAGWSLLSGTAQALSWQPFVIMPAAYLIVFLIVWLWSTYNSLINLHHQVEQAWSQVDVQLKRRNDLIPNLVQIIEGFKQYENKTQQVVTEMRAQHFSAGYGVAAQTVKGLVPELRLTVERYPELKASGSFLKFQHSLIDTEQRIALARDYYSDIATFYNTRLVIIPQRYVASLARLHPDKLMEAADFERAPVRVQFVS